MNFQKRSLEQFEQSLDDKGNNLFKVGAQELIGRFKSKNDLYIYFTEILNYYLPPIEGVNREYLKQILKGDKLLLKMSEIKMIKVPKYDELSVKSLYNCVKDDQEILKFLPEMNEKSKPIDRQFFFNIINTLQPEYLSHIIKQTQDKRNNLSTEEGKKDYILISDQWLSQLTEHPFISKKNGRTIQLLKQSSKLFKARKPKQQSQSVISLKRFKGGDFQISQIKSSNTSQISNQNNTQFDNQQNSSMQQNVEMRFNI